jgi:hypothetical protein
MCLECNQKYSVIRARRNLYLSHNTSHMFGSMCTYYQADDMKHVHSCVCKVSSY